MTLTRREYLKSKAIAAAAAAAGWLFGTINTEERFEAHRLTMARREWARFRANDSLECRNCHSYIAMDFAEQSPRAGDMHQRFVATGERTCIDCHAGIAHRLPDMGQQEARIERGAVAPDPGQALAQAAAVRTYLGEIAAE